MVHARTHIVPLVALGLLLAGCGDEESGPMEPYLAGPPYILTVNSASQPSGPTGSTIIVEGVNFGSFQGSGMVLFSDGGGGTLIAPIPSPTDWANDFIVAIVPSGAASGPIRVRTAAGISNPIDFTVTQNSTFSPSTIAWTASSSLPTGLSGHAAVYKGPPGGGAGSQVYVLGGSDDTGVPRSDVLYANVGLDGHLGAWSLTTSLPQGIAFHEAVVVTPFNSRIQRPGFLYVLGGAVDAAGASTNAIYRGELNVDGTVAGWTLAGTLPIAAHSLGAAVFHGSLYIAGGAGAGNAATAGVYRALIDTTGALLPWQQLASLPEGRSYHSLLSFGGYLFALGGESAAVAPHDSTLTSSSVNDVLYSRIDLRTGVTGGWAENSTKLTKEVSKHTAVLGGGYILVTAGLYNGSKSGASEESYAQITGNGIVSSFNGATGSSTIASAGGACLFNHAAVAYTDATGTSHVLVIGGDDVNQPGTKRAETWFY